MKLDLQIFSPKLMQLDENQRFSALFILLDICVGEMNVMQNIGGVDFVTEEPRGAKPVTLVELKDVLEKTFETQGWELSSSPLGSYVAYELDPQSDNLREDIFIGYTCSTEIINNYMSKKDDLFLASYQEGVIYGYLYYNNEQVEPANVVTLRQDIEEEILIQIQNKGIAEILGGATGNKYSYIDFIIYDIDEFLPIAKEVLSNYEFSEKGYSDFIYSAKPIPFEVD